MRGNFLTKAAILRTALSLALIGAAFLSSGCYFSKDARKQRAFDSGQQFMAENRVKEAQIQFQRAVNLDSQFAMAQYMLGAASVKLGENTKAYNALLAAIKLRPTYYNSNAEMAELLIRARKYKEARAYAQTALDAKPGDSRAQELLAYSYGGTGDLEAAAKELETLIEHDPGAVTATLALARLKLRTKDPAGAEDVLKGLVAKNPTSANFISLGNFYLTQGKTNEAEAALKKAVAIDPKSPDPLYQLGLFYLVHNRRDEAEPLFQKLSAEHQDDPRHRGALARFHFYGGQQEKGIADMKAILQKYPDDIRNRDTLVAALVETNKLDEASTLLDNVLKKDPKDRNGRLYRGAISLQRGKIDPAISDFLEVLHQDPASSPAHYYMGMAQLERHSPGLAKQEFGDALKYQPSNLQARVGMVELLLQEGSTEAALEIIKETPPSEQANYSIRLEKARVEVAKGDLLAAQQDLAVLTQRFPNQPGAFASLGAFSAMRKDWRQAQSNFQQALKLDPHNAIAVEGLAQVYANTGEAGGESVYLKMAADNPTSSAAAIGLARVREAQHKDGEAEKGLRQFLSTSPNDIGALKMLADLRIKSKDVQGAEAISKQIASSHPDDTSAHDALAKLYIVQNRPKEAMQEYREALKRNPDDLQAANNLAWLITQNGGNIDEALALAEKCKEKAPNNPQVADALGWIYLKKGNVKMATVQFQDALRPNPKNQEVLYHLGLAQYRSGNMTEASKTLNAAVSGHADYPGVDEARRTLQSIKIGR